LSHDWAQPVSSANHITAHLTSVTDWAIQNWSEIVQNWLKSY